MMCLKATVRISSLCLSFSPSLMMLPRSVASKYFVPFALCVTFSQCVSVPRAGPKGFAMTAIGTGVRNMSRSTSTGDDLSLDDVGNFIVGIPVD